MAKDTSFYSIVVLVAVIILVLTLIWLGIQIAKKGEDADFPPHHPTCPDFWEQNGNECTVPTNKHPNRGGTINPDGSGLALTADNTPGFNEQEMTIDMSSSDWKADGNEICKKRTWANEWGLVWDGVSNFNKC